MRTRALKIILIVAALARFGLLAGTWNHTERLATPDTTDYYELCANLIAEGTFQRDGRPEVFRTPGYPFFMALGVAFGSSMPLVIAAAQIALDVLVVYLTFLIGMMLCDERIALWAALFQAVATVSIVASLRTLADGIFTFTLVFSVLLLVHHFRTNRRWSVLAAAVAAGLGCYVKPVGLIFCVLGIIVLIFHRRGYRLAGTFVGIVLVLIAPWVIRNAVVGEYVGLSSFATESMYKYSVPPVLARCEGGDREDVAREMAAEEESYRHSLTPSERTAGRLLRYRRKIVAHTIAKHPVSFAGIHIRRSLVVWVPGVTDVLEILGVTSGGKGTLEVLHTEGIAAGIRYYLEGKTWVLWICAPAVVVLAAKYFFAVVCVLMRARFRMGAGGWLILLTILTFAFAGGPAATPRFRAPIAPLLSLIAAAGLISLADRVRKRTTRARR